MLNLKPKTMSKQTVNLVVNLEREDSWITFMDEGWETIWHPLTMNGKHLPFDSHFTMEIAKERFSHRSFGIARTSQMLMGNAQRDNL